MGEEGGGTHANTENNVFAHLKGMFVSLQTKN